MQKQKVSSGELYDFLRKHLESQAYRIVGEKKPMGAGGADLIAEKEKERICVEIIGYKEQGSARRSDFIVAFWQAISRLNDSRVTKTVIGLDEQFKQGLPARIDQNREGWQRIGRAFPELEIWFVNRENGNTTEYRWSDLPLANL